jgi:hypothetical protein
MLLKTTDACRIQMSLSLFDGNIGIDTGFFLQAADADKDGVEDVIGEWNQVARFAEHAFPRDRMFVL